MDEKQILGFMVEMEAARLIERVSRLTGEGFDESKQEAIKRIDKITEVRFEDARDLPDYSLLWSIIRSQEE